MTVTRPAKRENATIRELKLTWKVIRRSKITLLSIGVVLTLYALAILAPLIAPYDPTEMHLADKLQPPSDKYPLGTDHLGRDLLSRILHGARYSLFAALFVVAVTILIGVPVGLFTGYFGGKFDEVVMRFVDIIMAFPDITLALLIAYLAGRGILSASLALALVGWTALARIVRGVVLVEKEKDYVIAAKVLGKSDLRILFGEILPNSLYPVIIDGVMRMGTVIIALAGLSFIGVGVQPPEPDWGIIAAEGRKYLLDQPWLSIFPGLMIIVTVLAYNMIGDRLRDALDPRLKRELAGLATGG
jgi:peptide/nickel transport system permease protein